MKWFWASVAIVSTLGALAWLITFPNDDVFWRVFIGVTLFFYTVERLETELSK